MPRRCSNAVAFHQQTVIAVVSVLVDVGVVLDVVVVVVVVLSRNAQITWKYALTPVPSNSFCSQIQLKYILKSRPYFGRGGGRQRGVKLEPFTLQINDPETRHEKTYRQRPRRD